MTTTIPHKHPFTLPYLKLLSIANLFFVDKNKTDFLHMQHFSGKINRQEQKGVYG
jgi:hypothetical protein